MGVSRPEIDYTDRGFGASDFGQNPTCSVSNHFVAPVSIRWLPGGYSGGTKLSHIAAAGDSVQDNLGLGPADANYPLNQFKPSVPERRPAAFQRAGPPSRRASPAACAEGNGWFEFQTTHYTRHDIPYGRRAAGLLAAMKKKRDTKPCTIGTVCSNAPSHVPDGPTAACPLP